MPFSLQSGNFHIEVNALGAELRSLKYKGKELLWQADPAYWGRHAPVLFPIVGRLRSDLYRFEQQEYHLPQHGFARDHVFRYLSGAENTLTFQLDWNEGTLQMFPFRFHLMASFSLSSSGLSITYRVWHEDDKPMYFSIGAHPAFQCPAEAGLQFEDYALEFSEPETLDRQFLSGGLFNGHSATLLTNEKCIPLAYTLFEQDALVFHHPKSASICLRSAHARMRVEVDLLGAPFLGIWSKPGAPFICIEPWQGLADSIDATGNLADKNGIIALQPGATFDFAYRIRVQEND